ncbi:hypothetical protein EHYA_05477 [Embleya hyalina]|uniref:Uncharacterized protein n=1 Tax=Embleya hyalina TaxID=516124 RepID=A0A401YT52_9ACTN|nr:hypothetical protein EHYA_05477 [Embleya hyalina]
MPRFNLSATNDRRLANGQRRNGGGHEGRRVCGGNRPADRFHAGALCQPPVRSRLHPPSPRRAKSRTHPRPGPGAAGSARHLLGPGAWIVMTVGHTRVQNRVESSPPGGSPRQTTRPGGRRLRPPGPCPLDVPVTGRIQGRPWHGRVRRPVVPDRPKAPGGPGPAIRVLPRPEPDADDTARRHLIRGRTFETAVDEHGHHAAVADADAHGRRSRVMDQPRLPGGVRRRRVHARRPMSRAGRVRLESSRGPSHSFRVLGPVERSRLTLPADECLEYGF